MRKRNAIAGILAATMLFGSSMTANAYSPFYKPPKLPTIPEIHVELSDGLKDAIKKEAEEAVENLDIKILQTPEIVECRYIHGRAIWDKSRLQIRWEGVPDATSYEIKIVKTDGAEKTYTETDTSLLVYPGDDEFITSCINSATVQIRAVENDGEHYSLWSEGDVVACNQVFH